MQIPSNAARFGRCLTVLASFAALGACATIGLGEDRPFDDLEADWTVDLRPSLEDDSYTQRLELEIDRAGEVSGLFYDGTILAGQAGRGQGRLCVSFRTSDNSGPYHHAACLEDDELVGQTWSEGRDFIQPWTATR